MHSLGKIFIGLICVMSIVFMSFAVSVYSTSNNWRETAQNLKKELDDAKSKNNALSSKLTDLQKNCEDMLAEKGALVSTLHTEAEEMRKQHDSDQRIIADLRKEVATASGLIQTAHSELSEARGQLISLRNTFRDTQKKWSQLFDDYVKETDKSHDLALKLSSLESVSLELVKQYEASVQVLKQFGLKPNPELYTGVPPFQVAGRITEVRSTGMVEITIGEDSGLVKGHQLDVYRKADGRDVYLGVVEVVLTEPDKAACKILPEYRKGTVQVDDIVTSEFSQERQKYQIKRNSHVATSF